MEQCADFAALKEFKLLQLLSTDKKALAAARRLGLAAGAAATAGAAARQGQGAARDAMQGGDRPAGAAGAPPARPTAERHAQRRQAHEQQQGEAAAAAPAPAPPCANGHARHAAGGAQPASTAGVGNSRQRRRAARSARQHAQRREAWWSRSLLAIAFTIRLRIATRRARAIEAAAIDAARAQQDQRASYAAVVVSPNKRRLSTPASSCNSAASSGPMLASAGSSDADPSDLVGFYPSPKNVAARRRTSEGSPPRAGLLLQ